MNSPERARLMLEGARGAAMLLAVLHFFCAPFQFTRGKHLSTLLGSNHWTLFYANICGGLIAVYLMLALKRRLPLWVYWGVLTWSVVTLIPPLTTWLYGFSAGGLAALMGLGILASIDALRGWYGLRRFEAQGVES